MNNLFRKVLLLSLCCLGFLNAAPVIADQLIMTRIKGAELYSPIAVFTKRQPLPIKGFGLVAVFGDTIETRRIAIQENISFVGMFSKNDNLKSVEILLNRVLVV